MNIKNILHKATIAFDKIGELVVKGVSKGSDKQVGIATVAIVILLILL